MDAFKCDRCNGFHEGSSTLEIDVEKNTTGTYLKIKWDLCKKCAAEFRSFVANHPTETT